MELVGHDKEVLKTIELFNEDLISCSDDLNMIIWKKEKENFKCVKNLSLLKNVILL